MRHGGTRHTTAIPGQRISGYVKALARRQRGLEHIDLMYQNQRRISPLQVVESIKLVESMRGVGRACRSYLEALAPQETGRLKPGACLLKLGDLDHLLTELLLNMQMHLEVCEQIHPARVQVHMVIRLSFPRCIASYEDTTAMLSALEVRAHDPAFGRLEERERTHV